MRLVKVTGAQRTQFTNTFHIDIGQFVEPPLFDFNIFLFEQWLNEGDNPIPDNVSMEEHVRKVYGDEAVKLVRSLFSVGLR
jgi:hypothetical protein